MNKRQQAILKAYQQGKGFKEIGNFHNLTRQRIGQLVDKLTNLFIEVHRTKNMYFSKRAGTAKDKSFVKKIDKLTY